MNVELYIERETAVKSKYIALTVINNAIDTTFVFATRLPDDTDVRQC